MLQDGIKANSLMPPAWIISLVATFLPNSLHKLGAF